MPERGSKRQRCHLSEQLLEFFRRDPNDFLSRLVTMDETWLYHYDPETKQQSMEWRHSGSPRPRNSKCKNPLEKFPPRVFGIKTWWSSLIIFQRAKLSTRSITHLCWCNWRIFWRENAGRGTVTKGVLFLTDNAQAHRTLATQKKLVHLGLQCLDNNPPYSPDLDLSDYRLFPGLKNSWNFAIFRPTRRSLLPRRPGWTDKIPIFFERLAKVGATGLEVYWSSWGVCWINPEFGRCSLFPSWSG